MQPDRDFTGYAGRPPAVRWPDGSGLALSIVVNYEEGAEPGPFDGDPTPEARAEFPHTPIEGRRDLAIESQYEYGSRVGIWRILEALEEFGVRATVFACGRALERNPAVGRAIVGGGHEPCSHGYKWREPNLMDREEEARAIDLAIAAFRATTGERPVGWYSRWGPSVYTRELLVDEGGFLYDSDAYNDDVPYVLTIKGRPHVVVPYSMDANDMKFWVGAFTTSREFSRYLVDSYLTLERESRTRPRMMSVGVHARIAGRPGRIDGLRRFLEMVTKREGQVWIARRDDIARHWLAATAARP